MPASWAHARNMTAGCGIIAVAAWQSYLSQGWFLGRIIAGVAVAVYGLWLGNGVALPRPFDWYAEIPLLLLCAVVSGILLIDPPEKGVSIRRVLLKGHPEPEHPDNQLPGMQETLCHLLGYFLTLLNGIVMSMRLVYGVGRKKKTD